MIVPDENHSIFVLVFVEAKFNCSMRNHRCGWQYTGSSFPMKTEYNEGTVSLGSL